MPELGNPWSLAGRSAVVTGGSSGLGAAIVHLLATRGARVLFTYPTPAEAASAHEIASSCPDGRAVAVQADVRDEAAAARIVGEAAAWQGSLDILVNNAGINRDGYLAKMSLDDFRQVLDVNLIGAFLALRAAAGVFRQQKSGRVVNVVSVNALRGKSGQSNYTASKAGLVALTRTAARELGSSGVTVNAVAPGMIEGGMGLRVPDEIKARATAETCLGRLGTPDDVAEAVAFLCSDAARHITGHVLVVDGGQLA